MTTSAMTRPVEAPAARRVLANAIRALSMDAVQAANSGHPGAPLGMADLAEVLWRDFLRHNPGNPAWANRDRFILSNGHGSMLLYALLHLTGYDLPLEELKNFRQFGSKTAGHPEVHHTPGVETTTGPLGQGIANGVGMALAEKILAAQFNRDGFPIVDHHTYVFLGDGCLMEGISHEACSLAGTLGLGKLIALYDDNQISIDGNVVGWFTDDTPARFRAYGWQVIEQVDGHDPVAVHAAITAAQANTTQPTLICCRTVIGFGSPNKSGKSAAHGAPLGEAEIVATREQLGWTHPAFEIPADVYAAWDGRPRGAAVEAEWQTLFDAYAASHAELAAEFTRRTQGELPAHWGQAVADILSEAQASTAANATRKSSQLALEKLGPLLPEFVGGSADLAESNLTHWAGSRTVTAANAGGNYVNYGVREFAMAAAMNGLSLHGGFIPYGGTFLVFSDYARNAIRMAALMNQRAIYVLTHDSIGLGEDGPTHQPVEHTASLRLIPNCAVWRPCDNAETTAAWIAAVERQDGPTALILTRQGLPPQARDEVQLANIRRGGYVLLEPASAPQAILIATGSEVSLAVDAAQALNADGHAVRVVSMPSTDAFLRQDAAYRESVLPAAIRHRVALEAGIADYWYRFVGLDGLVIGMESFGASAPAAALFKHFGFGKDAVLAQIGAYLKN